MVGTLDDFQQNTYFVDDTTIIVFNNNSHQWEISTVIKSNRVMTVFSKPGVICWLLGRKTAIDQLVLSATNS